MTADYGNDDWLVGELTFDRAQAMMVLRLTAKKPIRVVELQGANAYVEAFGLSMPSGFREMQFGEGAGIPDAMKNEIAHINRLNFRWGCDLPIKPGQGTEIRIPAAGAGQERAHLELVYEYPRLLGLAKGRNGFYVRLSPNAAAQVA